MNKREYILLKLVEQYIQRPEPVSSRELQKQLDIALSTAAIRYYFKQLTEAGSLQKPHRSSGRIPTLQALRGFWRERLKGLGEMEVGDEEEVKVAAKSSHIFCEYYLFRNRAFTGMERYRNYLVCTFEGRELIVEYNKNMERFLQNQIGKRAFELSEDCRTIGLVHFAKSVRALLQESFTICTVEEIVEISRENPKWADENLPTYLDGTLLYERDRGLLFESDLLSYKFQIVKEEDLKGEMLLLGRVYRDFGGFINTLKGVDHG
ncbi:MAG: hypothetical protein GXO19_05050 [Epsilonproteobacteria bacterium]|nr:hypothetical protein [Campylobacterota bacterium]NPA57085.1 hypothetical protein [Campylobacterota bacterium]